ncbi:MAG: class I SAM-dependent methyltransferase [Caulobacter sp.]|jgi:predicted methyltransferase
MISRRTSLVLGLAAGASAMVPGLAFADDALKAAVAGAWRGEANRARDVHRHPYETLLFWGLKPGMTVVEISPGGGYWTEILAPYLKATGGTYIATAADLDNPELSEAAKKGRESFAAKYGDEAIYGKVNLANFGPKSKALGPAGSADLVMTARNLHNWMRPEGLMAKVLGDCHAVLKSGGLLGVEEHRSDPKPQAPGASTGYMETAFVVAEVEKAGFKLAAKSEINANPKDTKDHPFGVWTLPPSGRTSDFGQPANPAFDRAPYDAIGESDRMTLRFTKA